MIKIVVAEDQPLILKDLCRKIEKCGSDLEISGAATNGQSALELVRKLHPDILFTDIKMPVMSGLEVISQMKEEGITAQAVIISGFRDFEFAREAMKLGVDEYLLKPLSADDIAYVLSQLKEKISMQKQDYTRHMLESLIQSSGSRSSHISMAFPHAYYQLLLVTAGSYPTFLLDYALPYGDPQVFLPLEELGGKLLGNGEEAYLFDGKHEKERICLLCLNSSAPDEIKGLAKDLLPRPKEGCLPLTVCISRIIRHVDSLGMEVQILRTFTERNLIFGKSSLLEAKPFQINMPDLSFYLTGDRMQKFLFCAKNRDADRFSVPLSQVLKELEAQSAPQITVRYCLKKLFKDCFHHQASIDFDLEIDEYITCSKNYGDLYSYLKFLTKQAMEQTAADHSSEYSDGERLVAQIQKYMEDHYSNNININDIATAFSLTPAYLSRMFKKHTGTRPIEYLTSIRIKSACEYFASSDFSVRQVAELCGYSDQYYFSKAFKSITGKSPSEYRILSGD